MSIAPFNCPHCIDSFAFDWQKLKELTLHSRVEVRCPGCGNIVEVVTNTYSLIHHGDPDKYQWGEILKILPPDPKTIATSSEVLEVCWFDSQMMNQVTALRIGRMTRTHRPGDRHENLMRLQIKPFACFIVWVDLHVSRGSVARSLFAAKDNRLAVIPQHSNSKSHCFARNSPASNFSCSANFRSAASFCCVAFRSKVEVRTKGTCP